MEDSKIKDWVKSLVDNDAQQLIAINNLLETTKMLHALIEQQERRISKLEQKSSISYLRPLIPEEWPF